MSKPIVDISKARVKKQQDAMKDRFVAQLTKMNDMRSDYDEGKFQHSLELLLKHARKDTGGGKRCAMFILSLWNGDEFHADLQALMYTDPDIFDAMIYVFRTLYGRNQQLDSVVTEDRIKPIYEMWGGTLRLKEFEV